LVVPGGVQDEVTEQFTGGLGDDADVAVLDEQQEVGSGVGSSDADVVEPAVVADGDGAGYAVRPALPPSPDGCPSGPVPPDPPGSFLAIQQVGWSSRQENRLRANRVGVPSRPPSAVCRPPCA
jgi:hypothetical protein